MGKAERTPDRSLPPVDEVTSIVALMLGEIGDLLVTTPTLAALKQRYPRARLSLIVRRPLADLVAAHPAVDELVLYDNRSRWTKAAFLVSLRLRYWDLWVDLHTPTFNTWNTNEEVFRRNRWFMRAARTRFRRAFALEPIAADLTHPAPAPDEAVLRGENIVTTTLRLAGNGPHRAGKVLGLLPEAEAWAAAYPPLAGRRLLGLFFGAKQGAKVWPLEHAIEFCRALPERYPEHSFVLLGGPHEVAYVGELQAALPAAARERIVDVTNLLSLAQTGALLARCDAVVATDSGPMHMADALGRPLVALMSAHNHAAVWRPLVAAVLRADVPCSPCLKAECTQHRECMYALTPEMALTALAGLLAPAKPSEVACA